MRAERRRGFVCVVHRGSDKSLGQRATRVGGRRYPAAVSNSSQWATGAANKFREVERTTENPTTKLLAQGLMQLAEAVRDLGAELERVEKRISG